MASTIQSLHYSPEAYDSLPSLGQAIQDYEAMCLEKIIKGPIQDLFIRHDTCKTFGVILLHRHFDIGHDERLVERGAVSTPWHNPSDNAASFARYGGHVVPRTFRLLGDQFQPVEFSYQTGAAGAAGNGAAVKTTEEIEAFLRDYADLLSSHGVDKALGIRILDSRDAECPVESTEGKANIMFPRHETQQGSLIEVLWVFQPEQTDDCVLQFHCYKSSKGAGGHVTIFQGHSRT